MEVTSLIERHRQRLQEHRKFLNETTPNDDSSGDHSLAVAPRSASREGMITSTLSKALQASERTTHGEAELHRTDVNGFHDNNEVDEMTAIIETVVSMDDGQTPVPTTRHPSKSQQGTAARMTKLAQSHSTVIPSTSTAFFFGYAGEQEQTLVEDRLLERHLSAAGKYFVKGPADAMYQRSQWWLTNKEKQLKQQEDEARAAELSKCTFHPQVEAIKNGADSQRGASARSLTPNSKRTKSPAAPDPEAMNNHLLRQKHARQLRDEARRRLEGPDISQWAPRQTVPVEFELGKKSVSISSLRQPVWSGPALDNSLDGEADASSQQWHSAASFEPSSRREGIDDKDLGTPRDLATAFGSSARNNRNTVHSSDERDCKREQDLERQNKDLKQTVAEQAAQLQSLRRELEIAKDMVRKMSLAQSGVVL